MSSSFPNLILDKGNKEIQVISFTGQVFWAQVQSFIALKLLELLHLQWNTFINPQNSYQDAS